MFGLTKLSGDIKHKTKQMPEQTVNEHEKFTLLVTSWAKGDVFPKERLGSGVEPRSPHTHISSQPSASLSISFSTGLLSPAQVRDPGPIMFQRPARGPNHVNDQNKKQKSIMGSKSK